ncbi:type III PLP-dependent enzyme [Lipingzhangella sp. LS1_29]|uniref:ornithine decarboxylase n=1 Tax=Lipingzhangella rawalii TaxID=2055835 RepID=A0ABU2H8B9_9ACTN|nr:type III PLP-dependent enzyme [Lipingzhangella rawalii]MDS1271542.1 type III PLP-dependent enzyme [Lipingzhangella rawalii]
MTDASIQHILDYLDSKRPDTPCLVVDLGLVERRFREFTATFPDTDVYYAVKANPHLEVIRTLVDLGASFDVASPGEIDLCLEAGASPERLSYGNTIKKRRDIAYAYSCGVRTFVFDSAQELEKIAAAAPGSQVLCRIRVSSEGARWSLSEKFGCGRALACELLRTARSRELVPYGVAFHIGSQQQKPERWNDGIAEAARVFHELACEGIALEVLNLGGGFAAQYRDSIPNLESYRESIETAVSLNFPDTPRPQLAAEPGRHLVADAGVLRSEIVLVADGGERDGRRWVYLDIGRFGGLAETDGEAIQYRLSTSRGERPEEAANIAGPTCDSADVLYRDAHYLLPTGLAAGDHIDIHSAGAYTTSYASVGFNGMPPPDVHCIGATQQAPRHTDSAGTESQ